MTTVPMFARDRKAILDAALAKYEADGWRIENRTDYQATIKKREYRRSFWETLIDFCSDDRYVLPTWDGSTVCYRFQVVTVDDCGTIFEQKGAGEPTGLDIVRRTSAASAERTKPSTKAPA